MIDKVDAILVGTSFAQEVVGDPGYLPGENKPLDKYPAGGVFPGVAVWFEMEPNSYRDWGGNFKKTARAPMGTRKKKKGNLSDLDASGGMNTDITQNNMPRLAQHFFFSDLREAAKTQPINRASTAIAITSVDAATKQYRAAAGLNVFAAKLLVLAEGHGIAANNGLKTVTASAGGAVTVNEALTNEAAPPATARLTAVAVQLDADDASLTVGAGTVTLETDVFDLTTLNRLPGEIVFLGGDLDAHKFDGGTNKPGYARIASIAANAMVFDKTTWTPANDAGAGKSIRLFFGSALRDEPSNDNIVYRSVQLERKLGNDGQGIQSELLPGSFGNEFNINQPIPGENAKVTVDISFVSFGYETRSGFVGPKPGTRIAAMANEEAFNTSRDLYQTRVQPVDPLTLNPLPFGGYITECNISIKNNATPAKGQSKLGAFGIVLGSFDVGGVATMYFTTVAAINAIKNNSDATAHQIFAKRNAGIAIDYPLIDLGDGRLSVEKDRAVMLPLATSAYESPFGHTVMVVWFHYLPNSAMPQ